eukprot:SAG25_NODE_1773_length_2360_cov_2.922158_1_plen_119_part_10
MDLIPWLCLEQYVTQSVRLLAPLVVFSVVFCIAMLWSQAAKKELTERGGSAVIAMLFNERDVELDMAPGYEHLRGKGSKAMAVASRKNIRKESAHIKGRYTGQMVRYEAVGLMFVQLAF